MSTALATAESPYQAPTRLDRRFDRLVQRLIRMGISVWGARELRVVGRRSGAVRTTVVNVLTIDHQQYLVAPRGRTDWVRNLRAAGRAELRVGRRVEAVEATELADVDKPEVLRPYLARWAFEVGRFFDGVGAEADLEELRRIAPDHPVFLLTPASGSRD